VKLEEPVTKRGEREWSIREGTVHSVVDWIKQVSERHAGNVAATGIGGTLTFEELWGRSMGVAAELVRRGVGAEQRVGLWGEQHCDLLVGIVGILAAGATYVPLDPSYPTERLDYIVSDAGLSIVVAPDDFVVAASRLNLVVVSTAPTGVGPVALPAVLDERHAAYVVFTSGSTGRPKGVVVEHGSLLALLGWMAADLEMRPGDRLMGTASAGFDASVPNFLLPLVTGGTFLAVPSTATRNPHALIDCVEGLRPNVLQTSPTMLRMLAQTGWAGGAGLIVMTGGEPTAASAIRYLVPRVRRLHNYYGPTETTVLVTGARLGSGDAESPVGVARDGVGCLLLDEDGEPVTPGAVGELFVTGSALARGYLNDPAMTARRYVSIPDGHGGVQRSFRTGDMARHRPDGSLVILGRIDDQLKLRGYRIELGEIEQRLTEHPQITDAVVAVQDVEGTREPRLVAFVIATGVLDERALRSFLRQTLPGYMVPPVFRKVDELPLTPNGKVDRKLLVSDLSAADTPSELHERKRDAGLSGEMLDLLATVLSVDATKLEVDDDFFELGGTSLQALDLFARIDERFGVRLPLSTLVTGSTAARLAVAIGERGRSIPLSAAVEAPRDEWERVLANLWSAILGVRPVVRSDDFFALGGDEAAATRMLAELRSLCGLQVTVSEVRRARSLAGLATLTGGRGAHASLVALNTAGSKTPFFCVAGAGGLALSFLPLARRMGPDQPFYGLQAHGLEKRGLPNFTLGRAASRYVRAIRTVQPHGPYLIGGHSLGGVLALLVARDLQSAGEEIALLTVFDSYVPDRLTTRVRAGPPGVTVTRLGGRVFYERPKLSTVLRLPLAGLVPQSGITQFELFGLRDSVLLRMLRSLPTWSGRAAVYTSDDLAPTVEISWSQLLNGPRSFVPIPGGHLTILQEPYVAALAENLGEQIDRAVDASMASAEASPVRRLRCASGLTAELGELGLAVEDG
jgi:amino acid adenylation domain-containing protein